MELKCKVIKVIVDFIPKSCGQCPMMQYSRNGEWPCCVALPEETNGIEGNPYDMNYRRSDCPLCKDTIVNAKFVKNAPDDIICYCSNCLMPSDGFTDECLSCGAKIDNDVNEQFVTGR